ncbi:MAG: hypothetical protein ACREVZ_12145 [Burkholderiales bacterium]
MVPDKKDTRFFDQAAGRVTASEGDQETICVLKCNRVLTIRETAEMMSQGIRIYRGAPFFALFARVPASAAEYLREFEAVDWVGELTPEMKYNTKAEFSPGRLFWVSTLVGDANFCGRDLEALGGHVYGISGWADMHHDYEEYTVGIAPDRIPEVAALWWVQAIYQSELGDNEEVYVASDSLANTALPASGFYPLDSWPSSDSMDTKLRV